MPDERAEAEVRGSGNDIAEWASKEITQTELASSGERTRWQIERLKLLRGIRAKALALRTGMTDSVGASNELIEAVRRYFCHESGNPPVE